MHPRPHLIPGRPQAKAGQAYDATAQGAQQAKDATQARAGARATMRLGGLAPG